MTKATMRLTAIGVFLAMAILAPLGLALQGRGGAGGVLADVSGGSLGACSDANLQGTYGGYASGFILNGPDGTPLTTPSPLAAVGMWTYDGAGGVTLAFTFNSGGTTGQVSGTGTYTVNPDCSGTGIENLPNGGVNHFAFVVQDGGSTIRLASTDASKAEVVVRELLPPGGCSDASLQGSYDGLASGL